MASYDVLIRGGLVVDGCGVAGKIVAPGFIDIDIHSDMAHLIDPRAESQISPGRHHRSDRTV
jgi:N-acyl-D-aspartate/D-glutamate deacylase